MERVKPIFFLCFVIIYSAACSLKILVASEEGNITLPDPVEERGFLEFQRYILARVDEKKLKIFAESYKERLHWNRSTGYFTLTNLQKTDSGMYLVGSQRKESVFINYQLTVYDGVPTPEVSVLNTTSESCSLKCAAAPHKNITLLWSKNLKIVTKVHRAASLPLTVFYQQDLNPHLQCVAENPAENKTVTVDFWTVCEPGYQLTTRHYLILGILLTTIACSFLLFSFIYIIWRFFVQQGARRRDL